MKKWTVSEPVNTEKNAFTIIDENGVYVAEMFCGGAAVGQAEPEEAEANARLMSCAQDLLETVKALRDDIQMLKDGDWDGSEEGCDADIRVANEAIAKAEAQS